MGKRESILDDFVTVVKTISKNGGYNNNAGLVTRLATDWMRLQPRDLPAAIIHWTVDEKNPRDLQGNDILSTLNVVVRGVVSNVASKNIDEICNEWAEDIEKVLMVDDERSTYAIYTNPTMVQVFNLPPETNRGIFDFTFTVKYQYLKGSP